MKLSAKTKKWVNIGTFIVTILLALSFRYSSYIQTYIVTVVASFDLMIIPGMFYYLMYRKKWLQEDVDIPQMIIRQRT